MSGIGEPELVELGEAGRLAVQVERERQAREVEQVAEAWSSWEEQEVAVVVFVKARGADHADALDRGRIAVSSALQQASDFSGRLEVRHLGQPVQGASVEIKGVVELGSAAANGFVRLTPSTRSFR